MQTGGLGYPFPQTLPVGQPPSGPRQHEVREAHQLLGAPRGGWWQHHQVPLQRGRRTSRCQLGALCPQTQLCGVCTLWRPMEAAPQGHMVRMVWETPLATEPCSALPMVSWAIPSKTFTLWLLLSHCQLILGSV